MRFINTIITLAIFLFLINCSSESLLVSKAPPENFTKLGPVEGEACGSIFVISTAYNFIPIMLNSRVDRAYKEAMKKYPEASTLINITISEDWYWFVLGTARCTTLKGVAIK